MFTTHSNRDVQWKYSILVTTVILFSISSGVLSSVTDRNNIDPSNDFKCLSGTVIPASFVCDGELDCGAGDKSDEQNCKEYHQSLREDDPSDELVEYDEVPQTVDLKTPEEDTAVMDDDLHDDVSSIGKSWYRSVSRNTRNKRDTSTDKEIAMLEFIKVATYYLKLESLKIEESQGVRKSDFTSPLVAFRGRRP